MKTKLLTLLLLLVAASVSAQVGRPFLSSPYNYEDGIGPNITFTWSKVTGAAGYEIEFSLKYDFSTLADVKATSNTSYTYYNIAENTTVYWRVRAHDNQYWGPYSSIFEFTTGSIPTGKLLYAKTGLCTNEYLTITSSNKGSNHTYKWTYTGGVITGGSTNSSLNVKYSNPGSYTVTLKVTNGYGSANGSVNLTVSPGGAVSIKSSNNNICNGTPITLTAEPDGMTYKWSTGETTRSIVVNKSGSYSVDAGSVYCDSKASIWIKDSIPLTITRNPAGPVCRGGSVELDAGAGFDTYKWSNGQTGRYLTVNKAGTYSVVATTAAGCTATGSETVNIYHTNYKISVSGLENNVLCGSNSVTMEAPASSDIVSYYWSNGSTSRTTTTKKPGKYTVVSNTTQGCMIKDSVILNFETKPEPVANYTVTNLCQGDVTQFKNTSTNATEYMWTAAGKTYHMKDLNIKFPAVSFYLVSLTATVNGACDNVKSESIQIHSKPVANITRGMNHELSAASGLAKYTWFFNGQEMQGKTTNSIVADKEGTYKVVLENAAGCTDTSDAYNFTFASIAASALKAGIKIYPNPAKDIINLDLGDQSTACRKVEILDLAGRILHSEPTLSQKTLSISVDGYEAGAYIVRIPLESGYVSQLIMVE